MDIQKVMIEYNTADGKRMHVDVSFEVKGLLEQSDRHIRSQARQDRRYLVSADGLYSLDDIVMSSYIDIADILICMESYERLYAAINKLSEVQRRRLRMYYFGELTYNQIAKIENVSVSSIQRSVKQALKRLRNMLNE